MKPLIATLATIAALLGGLFPSSAAAADDAGGDAGSATTCPISDWVWDVDAEHFTCDSSKDGGGDGGAGNATGTGTGGGGKGSAGDARTGSGGMGGRPATGGVGDGGARWRYPGSRASSEWRLLLAQQKDCRNLLQEIREEDEVLDNAERRGLWVDRREARKLRRRWKNESWDCESFLGIGSD